MADEKKKRTVEKTPAAKPPRNVPKDLADLLEKVPAKNFEDAMPVIKALLEKGPATVTLLVEAVGKEFGDPEGVKPKYALHGMVHYASRPEADAQRKMLAETLAKQLEAKHSVELQAFLCRQLQLCGRAEEVPALAVLLADERLCEPAAQALCAIGGQEAAAALRAALPKAQGKRRTTLVNALGRFRDGAAADEVRKSAVAGDAGQRLVAWYALGNMGDAASAAVLLKAAETEAPYERSQAADACLRLARRLGELGKTAEAQEVLRQLADRRKAAADVHDRCAILEALGKVLGIKAVPDVSAALESTDVRYRQPAAVIAVDQARAIRKEHPAEAEKLLKKVTAATKDEAVRQQAELLLGKQSPQEAALCFAPKTFASAVNPQVIHG
jgi:HEAT repeat protein